ncbi:MAG: hypothetical protein GY950_04435, partial [bacterium]|nr:hypothetical protein [bacterium]
MENLLSKRPKNIILWISGGFVLLAAVLYLLLFKPPHLDNTTVKKVMLSGLESIESALDKKISRYKNRAEFIFDRYRDQQLQHSELLAKEALVFTQNSI